MIDASLERYWWLSWVTATVGGMVAGGGLLLIWWATQ